MKSNSNTGFTLIELLIVITIMVVLVGISLGSFTYFRTQARDSERDNDIAAISRALERIYINKAFAGSTIGDGSVASYPSTSPADQAAVFTAAKFTVMKLDSEVLYSPGNNEGTTNGTTTNVITAGSSSTNQSPTINQYIYQPLTQNGTLCTSIPTGPCVKFNLYYQKELPSGVTVTRVTSRNQQ